MCRVTWFIILLVSGSSLGFLTYPFSGYMLDGFMHAINRNIQSRNDIIEKTFTPGAECNRKCDSKSKVCYFEWILENFSTMNMACKQCLNGNVSDCFNYQCVPANGHERVFTSINRQLPGPPIEVCENDMIVVDVLNEIEGSSTTIHWHGMPHNENPFMDGVPFISQCPIESGSKFRYTFRADKIGSFFYHSHSGHQKANGLHGALIVRTAEDQNAFEHVMVLSDWMHSMTEDYFPGVKDDIYYPKSLLINGHGRQIGNSNITLNTPLTAFHVLEGKTYKFRIIGTTSNVCPVSIQIEGHNFTVVAADSINVKPFVADTLYASAGERYDIVVKANQTSKDKYWIKVSTIKPCENEFSVKEFAVMIYHRNENSVGAKPKIMRFDEENPDDSVFTSFKEINSPYNEENLVTQLESYIKDTELFESEPDKSFYLSIGTPWLKPEDFFTKNFRFHKFLVTQQPLSFSSIGAFNGISFKFPKVPLLSQHAEIDEKIFCNETHTEGQECYDVKPLCFCTHRLVAPEYSKIELLLTNVGDPMSHPFHLHHFQFAVVDMGIFNETYTRDDLRETLGTPLKSFKNPPYKDTIIVPQNGYARLRFRSKSANLLFFHCHYEFHLQIGMAGFIQIGDLSSLPKPPKDFPQCRDFSPALK